MAGGEVIRSQRHHLPVLTGLGFAAVGSLQSSSAAGGGLSMHKTAHRAIQALEEEHRSFTLFNG